MPAALLDAFGGSGGLQRPPRHPVPDDEPAATVDDASPWRDPAAPARLGEPALAGPAEVGVEQTPAPRLTLRDALWGRRLRPSALVGISAVALLIGLVGAVVGSLLVNRLPASTTDAGVQLAEVQPGVERATGSVSDLASRVLPAVVSLEIRTGDVGGTGSGVVIDGAGYILTNNHVISLAADNPAAQLTVVFDDAAETRVPGTIVGRDPLTDLAVVKVDVQGATVAQLGDSDSLAVGDPVIAIGSPLGLAGTVTTGIVSAVDRPVRLQGGGSDTDAVIDAVQTDAAVNPGNSGGPLIDSTGAVVGINTAIRTLGGQESGSIGLGFAIPIDTARDIAQQIITTGSVTHAALGVNTRSATDGVTDGAQVQNVQAGGPAAAAGLAEGDVITAVGDRSVGNADELVVAVRSHEPGDQVPVTVLRDGREMTVTVTLGNE
ncbi:putative serine protease PepD [Nakamurella flavida]|uniref:S1C family serine protease n=1 Tax=Nakamurella flavida TaxID=363630 RepID=UPI002782A8B4|nr:trypsin-like peptidase domain-containing protein [Nakamurella flavida]MDP9776548.1 putative serine protease PepD [Nakamurella flavida]